MTFDDEVLFDAHRLTGVCVSPDRLDLVAMGQVWCRLLTGQQRPAARPVRVIGLMTVARHCRPVQLRYLPKPHSRKPAAKYSRLL